MAFGRDTRKSEVRRDDDQYRPGIMTEAQTIIHGKRDSRNLDTLGGNTCDSTRKPPQGC